MAGPEECSMDASPAAGIAECRDGSEQAEWGVAQASTEPASISMRINIIGRNK